MNNSFLIGLSGALIGAIFYINSLVDVVSGFIIGLFVCCILLILDSKNEKIRNIGIVTANNWKYKH